MSRLRTGRNPCSGCGPHRYLLELKDLDLRPCYHTTRPCITPSSILSLSFVYQISLALASPARVRQAGSNPRWARADPNHVIKAPPTDPAAAASIAFRHPSADAA